MEVEAFSHSLRWIASRGESQTTQAIILTGSMDLLQKVKSKMERLDWNVSMGNDRADRLAGKANLIRGLLLGRSEVSRSLKHYLRAQSQGHHTIDHLVQGGERR